MTRLEALNAMIEKLGGEGTATDELSAWQAVKTQMDAIVVVLNSISGGEETLYQTALDAVVVAQGGTGGDDILELCNELAVLLGAETAVDVLGALNNIITELEGTVQTDILAAYEELGVLLAEPAIEWDYEGTLTVGQLDISVLGGSGNFYGYNNSANPSAPIAVGSLTGFNTIIIGWFNGNASFPPAGFGANTLIADNYNEDYSKIELDGVVFDLTDGTIYDVLENPFPAVGETCTVKVKLAPAE